MQIFFFLVFPSQRLQHGPAGRCDLAAAASINIQLLDLPSHFVRERYQGSLRGPTSQTSGRPCCSYLLRQSRQESVIGSFGCLCYQQGRLVRVEGDDVAGTGMRNQCQGPTFNQWIAKGAMWGRRQRKAKK